MSIKDWFTEKATGIDPNASPFSLFKDAVHSIDEEGNLPEEDPSVLAEFKGMETQLVNAGCNFLQDHFQARGFPIVYSSATRESLVELLDVIDLGESERLKRLRIWAKRRWGWLAGGWAVFCLSADTLAAIRSKRAQEAQKAAEAAQKAASAAPPESENPETPDDDLPEDQRPQ